MSSNGRDRKRAYDNAVSEPNKRQKQGGPQCPTEEPHTCAGPSPKKAAYYVVWGGPNPGVHLTGWDTARKWIERHTVKQRKFPDAPSAWSWYQQQKQRHPGLASSCSDQTSSSARRSQTHSTRVAPPRASEEQRDHSDEEQLSPPQRRQDLQEEFMQRRQELQERLMQLHQSMPSDNPHTGFSRDRAFRATCAKFDLNPDFLSLDEDDAPFESPPPQSFDTSTPSLPNQSVHAVDDRLHPEQARLVDLIVNRRKNVFYTGSAGAGKSYVLKAFRRRLAAMGLKVDVIAPTGRAALDINGQTTWSYAGWTPGSMKKPLQQLRKDAWKKTVKKRLQRTDVLVIDEVSMVENHHLERLNVIMQEVRQDGRAFGGAQVVVTGDFCQLPPVRPFGTCIDCGTDLVVKAKRSAYECYQCHTVYDDEDKWAFKSDAWEHANFVHVNLKEVHRQKDLKFINILEKLRIGKPLLPEELEELREHPSNTKNAVRLFPLRADVKKINTAEFKKLKTEAVQYDCVDNFQLRNPAHNSTLLYHGNRANDGTLEKLKDHRYEPHLELKVNMLVVLLANLSPAQGLVNGSQGKIIGFEPYWVEEEEEEPDEKKVNDIEDTLEGDYKRYRAARILDFMKAAPVKAWPVVRFFNGVEAPIKADNFPTELGDEPPVNPNYSLISRTQIPLMAAWAMTVHKSQGMTLNRVEVDLSKNFEEGMAYVALSRATSLEGLKVISFPDNAQRGCNEEVKEFLRDKFNMT